MNCDFKWACSKCNNCIYPERYKGMKRLLGEMIIDLDIKENTTWDITRGKLIMDINIEILTEKEIIQLKEIIIRKIDKTVFLMNKETKEIIYEIHNHPYLNKYFNHYINNCWE